jgi:hypothetical protein
LLTFPPCFFIELAGKIIQHTLLATWQVAYKKAYQTIPLALSDSVWNLPLSAEYFLKIFSKNIFRPRKNIFSKNILVWGIFFLPFLRNLFGKKYFRNAQIIF